ncbi:MAG: 30S ribosomal protein THX [Runella zeae]
MGKGDRKTKRGKIWRGSNGVKRPSKKKITPPKPSSPTT